MKKVLVMGGTGAIGRHTVRSLLDGGYAVDVLSLDDVKSDNENLKYMVGNGLDRRYVEKILKDGKYDGVIDYMIYQTPLFAERYRMLLENTEHYIFLSSYRVYADDKVVTESTPRLLDVSENAEFVASEDYSLYKAREEEILLGSKYDNFTITRPSITYSEYRYQLVTLEANILVSRALAGKPIVLPEDAYNVKTTLTNATDSGKLFAKLLFNPGAKREAFTVATSECHTWGEIADMYSKYIGAKFEWVSKEDYLRVRSGGDQISPWCRYQLEYDRLFCRKIDNSKVLSVTGLSQDEFIPLESGLKTMLDRADLSTITPKWEESVCRAMDEYLGIK